ncbi:Transcription factor bHLH147 [Senna tora]|uniref:Transcription factor bHLH147 n=1 Tax=Senna tora TaxID=362788 RepID=A0A834WT85_9FABA|nr:Transcription factor bHLH147 [Senna tora]
MKLITGNGSFRQPRTNRPRNLTFLCTPGTLFPFNRRTLTHGFLHWLLAVTTAAVILGFLYFLEPYRLPRSRLSRVEAHLQRHVVVVLELRRILLPSSFGGGGVA